MTEKLIIQLLSESVIHEEPSDEALEESLDLDSDEASDAAPEASTRIVRHFRWGFADESSNWHAVSHEGSEEDLLQALEYQSKPATLLLPGSKVVTALLPYNKKEARHFLKLLPYEMEDNVLGSVDDLFFAVGTPAGEEITVGYVDEQWLTSLLSWFQEKNITVERCLAEYQCLHAQDDELVIWFTDGCVWGHLTNGLGFTVAESLSQAYLSDLLVNQQDVDQPWKVKVFVDDAETQEIVETHILPPVDYEVVVTQPLLDFEQACQLNFCRGKFGKKLPIDQWWQEAKSVAILSAAAVMVFFIATIADIYRLKQLQSDNQQALMDLYQEVAPRGPKTDPIRRLKSMANRGSGEQGESESSNSVLLLSKVAPGLDRLDITLTTLNYSIKERALRINVNADSFNGIEQFRQRLDGQGLEAELQSSGAAKEGYQGRLRIRMKGEV